ncbi:MAG: glycosyltransferase [Clostridia bacterium]|nr:glycosyltransferase [Clostridia bacterium]
MMKTAADTPLISVLVPVHNAEKWLGECVDSILAQTYPHFELVLVEDGSTDGCPALCDSYAAKDSRIRVIHRSNGGISAGRNTAAGAARGEYIAWVDADDRVDPAYLETLLTLCRRYDAPLSACNHFIWRPEKSEPCFSVKEAERLMTAEECCENVLYHGVPDVSVWGKLYHRSVMERVAYPDGLLYEDTWAIADALLAAGRMAYTPVPLYHYRIRPDSISRDVYSPAKLDFLTAADRLCERILTAYPAMEAGAVRRRTHAALSVRRYFVNCPPELRPRRDELEKTVRQNAWSVLRNPRAPKRDKIAILAVLCGPRFYDLFWKTYSRNR